jgi:hypothetical protein
VRQSRGFATVTTLCVALAISFYAWFTGSVAPAIAKATSSGPQIRFVVSLFAAAGAYVALFQGLLWLYEKFLEDRLNRREAIQGEWFYKLDIRATPNNPVYGICEIGKDGGKLSARAIHFDPKTNKFTSRFNSDFVVLEGGTLIIVYSSAGLDEDLYTRRGVYFLSTEGTPPRRVYGIWSDVLPGRNSGEMLMIRRDRHSDAFLRSIGYPIDSTELDRLLSSTMPAAPWEVPVAGAGSAAAGGEPAAAGAGSAAAGGEPVADGAGRAVAGGEPVADGAGRAVAGGGPAAAGAGSAAAGGEPAAANGKPLTADGGQTAAGDGVGDPASGGGAGS